MNKNITSKHIPFFAFAFLVLVLLSPILGGFFDQAQIAMIISLWGSLALEDVHVLQDREWPKKTVRGRFLSFFACLHIA